MTLVNSRAAFEQAVTDQLSDKDPSVSLVFDNLSFTTPGQEQKYVVMNINFTQSTIQNQGAATDYYAGVIQCNIYVPKKTGTKDLANIANIVIDGLTSVNSANYVDTYSVKPRVEDINGPTMLDIEDRSHFVGVISCQFTANA
tara:strand:- start:16 stop:444 length:429 start_codon:yes stop_codon:yes gene_type:complete